eukprot:538490_1
MGSSPRPDIIVPETGASRSSPSLQPESKEQQVAGKSTAVRCAQCVNIRNVMPEFQNNCFCNRPSFRGMLDLTQENFDDAKGSNGRLDKIQPIPTCLGECNNVQKRMVTLIL